MVLHASGLPLRFSDSLTTNSIVNLIGGNNGEGYDNDDKFPIPVLFHMHHIIEISRLRFFYFRTFMQQSICLRAQ